MPVAQFLAANCFLSNLLSMQSSLAFHAGQALGIIVAYVPPVY